MKRDFVLLDYPSINKVYGPYSGNNPREVAKKFVTFLSRKHPSDSFIILSIKDINSNKEYKYIGKRIKLEQSKTKKINNKYVTFNYKTIITKYKSDFNSL